MEGCVFCMIVGGEIPSRKVYEDDRVYAFDDITPQAPIHVLIVPKEHHSDLADDVSVELMGRIFSSVPEIARIKGLDDAGYRVVVNNGEDAGQTVGHLHVHVLGGRRMSHGMVEFAGE
ncbi:MAG: histidine triad nucleotide-binding protein [Coriobacteriia bacterium]|nr:histidine triad nucleotide-binding protein [Coriobacteriia bacterium]